MKTNKHPKTRTIFGVKCTVDNFYKTEWSGENKQFSIFIHHIMMSDMGEKKKFEIYVKLKTFFNVTVFGEGNTLKEAQIDLMCKFKRAVDGVQWLRFDMEDKCTFTVPYKFMKPGNLIEWYYKFNNKPVLLSELLWSSIMNKWIPVGIVSTLLHKDDKTYSWINSKGCFHARVDDIYGIVEETEPAGVFPRTRG